MFYFQNFNNIEPDVICLSKTFGGGKSSISCLVVRNELYNKAYGKLSETFLHTTTYNGFGEESITALEALNILSEDSFRKKVEKLSDLLEEKLSEMIYAETTNIENQCLLDADESMATTFAAGDII